jgi:hypothetical protein
VLSEDHQDTFESMLKVSTIKLLFLFEVGKILFLFLWDWGRPQTLRSRQLHISKQIFYQNTLRMWKQYHCCFHVENLLLIGVGISLFKANTLHFEWLFKIYFNSVIFYQLVLPVMTGLLIQALLIIKFRRYDKNCDMLYIYIYIYICFIYTHSISIICT